MTTATPNNLPRTIAASVAQADTSAPAPTNQTASDDRRESSALTFRGQSSTTGRPTTRELAMLKNYKQAMYSANPLVNFLHLNRQSNANILAGRMGVDHTSVTAKNLRRLHPTADNLLAIAFAFKLDPQLTVLSARYSGVEHRKETLDSWINDDTGDYREQHKLGWFDTPDSMAQISVQPRLIGPTTPENSYPAVTDVDEVKVVRQRENALNHQAITPGETSLDAELPIIGRIVADSYVLGAAPMTSEQPNYLRNQVAYLLNTTPPVETVAQWVDLLVSFRRVHIMVANTKIAEILSNPDYVRADYAHADTVGPFHTPVSVQAWRDQLTSSPVGHIMLEPPVDLTPDEGIVNSSHARQLGILLACDIIGSLVASLVADASTPAHLDNNVSDFVADLRDVISASIDHVDELRDEMREKETSAWSLRIIISICDVLRQYVKAIDRGVICPPEIIGN